LGELTRLLVDWFVPEPLGPYWAVGIVLLTAFTSAITAVLGIGGGLIMMAALLMVLPPSVVLPVHALIQLVSNSARAHAYQEFVDWPLIAWFTAGSVVGVAIASQVFVSIPEHWLLLMMGAFILWAVWTPTLQISNLPLKSFAIVGGLLSFLSFFVGATGPLFAAVTHNRSAELRVYIATHAMGVNVQHLFKLVVFGIFGFAFMEWLPFVGVTAVTSYLGTYAGRALLKKLPEKAIKLAFKWILTALALRLIYSALS